MPNAKTHLKAGAVIGLFTGAALNLYEQELRRKSEPTAVFNWQEFFLHCLVGMSVGTVGGIAPDILEPAYHSHHRRVCHSLSAFIALTYGTQQMVVRKNTDPYLRTAVVAGGAGYISHILLDAATPRSIPVV